MGQSSISDERCVGDGRGAAYPLLFVILRAEVNKDEAGEWWGSISPRGPGNSRDIKGVEGGEVVSREVREGEIGTEGDHVMISERKAQG
ncbi:hypothetical protein [Streptomyces sp. CBMA370]|uniref:hypothetical protein n=1 Tax=Streptomyces sp. CBMA370 TaxID=1930278 RepID=UPI001661FE5F|nr:hypothetical protein [Streptomyces sp. CBMA370]